MTDKLDIIKTACEEKLGEDIDVIKINNSVIADYFVIVSGSNLNQTKAIADEIEQKLSEAGYDSKVEGFREGTWILIDAGDIIVHAFTKDTREYYNLEKLWKEAE